MSTFEDVRDVVASLNLGNALSVVSKEDAHSSFSALELRHSTQPGATWIWEHLKEPQATRVFGTTDRAYMFLNTVVPDPAAQLYFLPGSDDPIEGAFLGPIGAIRAVIVESYAYEYVIWPADSAWLLGESHHGVLFAAGEPAASRLADPA